MLLRAAELVPWSWPANLMLLARWSTVSRSWKAAADAAAEAITEVHLESDPPAAPQLPPAALQPHTSLARWARHWERLHIGRSGNLLDGHALSDFVRHSCAGLQQLDLTSDRAPLTAARLEAVAAAAPGIARLTCTEFMPGFGVPAGLRRLTFAADGCEATDLKILVVRARALKRLERLAVTLWGGPVLLRAASLHLVEMRQLQVLQLRVVCTHDLGELDLSWLVCSGRAFELILSFWNEGDDGVAEDWVTLLQGVSGVLRDQDMLEMRLFDEILSMPAQSLLHGLRLSCFQIKLAPQVLQTLPEAPDIEVEFDYFLCEPSAAAGISWDAVLRTAGHVTVRAVDTDKAPLPPLAVSGNLGSSLLSSGPWRLQILGFTLLGLPPATEASPGSYVLMNPAALLADWD